MSNYVSISESLAAIIPNFKSRRSQELMAEAVIGAIEAQQIAVIEAGTGTGKTYAYLLPAFQSGKTVMISTGSKTLQDQLFTKDIPFIKQQLNFSNKVALLKGRANYLCQERLSQHFLSAGEFDKSIKISLQYVNHWSVETDDGDITKCVTVNEDSAVWPLVTSTNDNCLGAVCPSYETCYVVKARRRAMNADIIVVNHHLFFADIVVKASGFGELIPQADVMIFDEAHQLPDIASHYFGQQLSSRQFIDLAKEIMLIARTEVKDVVQLPKSADQLIKMAQDLRLSLGIASFKGNLRTVIKQKKVQQSIQRLRDACQFCHDVLKMSVGRSVSLDACFERIVLYQATLMRLIETEVTGFGYWFECTPYHFIIGITPLSIDARFNQLMSEQKRSWIFTSATLSVNGQLGYFTHRLGLAHSKQYMLPSPFDYEHQAILCVPRYLPLPHAKNAAAQLVTQLTPLINANKGRCFFLCTSHHNMRALTELFRQTLTLPVLMQGETSKTKLIAQFVEHGNALLIATNSFWEGVDVRGDTLSCVIIDKLPFSSPDDPLLNARIDDCILQQKDPFSEIQIPEAVITLKQGVGRLIRDHTDSGAIVICDSRLVMRTYGEVFLTSLPPLQRTRDLNKVIQFLTKKDEE